MCREMTLFTRPLSERCMRWVGILGRRRVEEKDNPNPGTKTDGRTDRWMDVSCMAPTVVRGDVDCRRAHDRDPCL